jgi:uroporphyrinogen-III synthase
MGDALAGRRIVVPETRELDVFARMLEQHGAITIRCPMVAINDVVDAAPVVAWLRRFTSDPPNDLILMTGEGLGRLVGFARRAGLEEAFMAALARVRKITRGPKPVRRLRALGLQPTWPRSHRQPQELSLRCRARTSRGERSRSSSIPTTQTSSYSTFFAGRERTRIPYSVTSTAPRPRIDA